MPQLVLPFTHGGEPGRVDVDVRPTTDPALVGAHPDSLGLAQCEARIDLPRVGYHALLGWVQLVRSTDNLSAGRDFEMDPLEILGQVSHPFCFFGIAPTLFDAPARTARPDMDWECHSFLCCVEGDDRREVRQLTGFSWGFRIASGRVDLFPVTADASWSRHQDLLTRSYPAWRFSRPG